MPLSETLITKAITEIVKASVQKGWKGLKRQQKVLQILDKVGLKPNAPEPDFRAVYVYTLVEFGLEKDRAVLEFFNLAEIRSAFKRSFDSNDPSILHMEADDVIEWHQVGEKLRDAGFEPRLEFAGFTAMFNAVVDRTRTPGETRLENKIDEIRQLLKDSRLDDLRSANLEIIQGRHADQLKAWFKALGYRT